jgi:hypothetical protein
MTTTRLENDYCMTDTNTDIDRYTDTHTYIHAYTHTHTTYTHNTRSGELHCCRSASCSKKRRSMLQLKCIVQQEAANSIAAEVRRAARSGDLRCSRSTSCRKNWRTTFMQTQGHGRQRKWRPPLRRLHLRLGLGFCIAQHKQG